MCVCVVILLTNNATRIYQNLTQPFQQQKLQDIISVLQKENINFAYGDYWVGYATTFLTNEKIIIEPIYSRYLPFYRNFYDQHQKSAVILPKENLYHLSEGMKVEIYSRIYQIYAKHETYDFDIYLLKI